MTAPQESRMTTLQEAAKRALEALEHIQRCIGFATATIHQGSATWCQSEDAIASIKAALAQQKLPQKERPDFMAGYDAGMADAKHMAQQGESPVMPNDEVICEALIQCSDVDGIAYDPQSFEAGYMRGKVDALDEIDEPSAQQEPVATVYSFNDLGGTFDWVSPPNYRPPVGAKLFAAAQALPAEELTDRLVAISSAVADSDDRKAQAMLSETLQLLAAARSQPEDGCAPNHICNGHRVHIPTGECCNKCGATSW